MTLTLSTFGSGHRSRSHEAEDRFGGLAEASLYTPLGRVGFEVVLYYYATRSVKHKIFIILSNDQMVS